MQAIGMASQRVVVVAEAAPEVDAWLVGAKWAAIGLGGVVCWAWYVEGGTPEFSSSALFYLSLIEEEVKEAIYIFSFLSFPSTPI